MASNINPNNIDTTFPIAGQDNDTQGFRTNYINIQNNFSTAASEITALQAKAAVAPEFVPAPYSGTSLGTQFQCALNTVNTTINILSTSSIGNIVTVSSTNNLVVGSPFVLAGGNIGGLNTASTYYITNIVDANRLTVGNISNASQEFPVSNSSATSITATVSTTYLYVCIATNSWVRTPVTTWSAA